jgi:hypothetical protein
MIRKDIIAPHFGHRGLLIRSTNIAYSPCSTLSLVEARTIGIALRKSFVRKVTDVCSVDHESRVLDASAKHSAVGNLLVVRSRHRKMKFARCCRAPASIACPRFGVHPCNLGDLLMRSKLAISALVVASLFGSTLIASAQSQPAPGASSEGNVGPGATSGKKTKHEKGMTTGSSRRSGANKGDAASPSGQGNVDPDIKSSAGPKSGGKY